MNIRKEQHILDENNGLQILHGYHTVKSKTAAVVKDILFSFAEQVHDIDLKILWCKTDPNKLHSFWLRADDLTPKLFWRGENIRQIWIVQFDISCFVSRTYSQLYSQNSVERSDKLKIKMCIPALGRHTFTLERQKIHRCIINVESVQSSPTWSSSRHFQVDELVNVDENVNDTTQGFHSQSMAVQSLTSQEIVDSRNETDGLMILENPSICNTATLLVIPNIPDKESQRDRRPLSISMGNMQNWWYSSKPYRSIHALKLSELLHSWIPMQTKYYIIYLFSHSAKKLVLFVFGSECFDLLAATKCFQLLSAWCNCATWNVVSKPRIHEMRNQNQEIMVLTLEDNKTNKTMIIA